MRLAIVALNAYPAIVPHAGTAIGGLETFAWSFARALARDPALQIQFVVRHTSKLNPHKVDGVELLCDVEQLRSIRLSVSRDVKVINRAPWLRIKHFRPRLLWQVPLLALSKLAGSRATLTTRISLLLRPAQPDGVLALGVGDGAAAAVRAAREQGVPSWLWIQSNADLEERFSTDENNVDLYGVTAADARTSYQADGILCQTQWQQDRVKQLLGRDSVVIQNPVDGERFPVGDSSPLRRKEVLWIGRFDRHHKRPLLALEVARLCPGIPFHLVINRGDPEVEYEIRRRLPPNVWLTDYVPRDAMPEAFRSARLFLSTGSNTFEGFPNVLLEAAASGTPIASLEEFDGFLERSGAGASSNGDVERLAARVREMWPMSAEWQACSRAGAAYVRREHTLAQCVQRFREVLRSQSQNS